MEGFAAVLMDGRPLPASSERLNERGAVIAQLPILLPEEGERQRRWGGGGRCVDVGEDDRKRSRPRERRTG